jgi:hypothetical protein
MRDEPTITGKMTRGDNAVWEPLLAAVGGHRAGWFMWMYEVELDDGTAVHVYKHISTRRSMHLTEDGRAFVFVGNEQYREIDRDEIVDLVHAGWDPADDP